MQAKLNLSEFGLAISAIEFISNNWMVYSLCSVLISATIGKPVVVVRGILVITFAGTGILVVPDLIATR